MKFIFTTITILVMIFSTLKLYSQVNTQDSLALFDLWKNTGGAKWTNHTFWKTSAPVSQWVGVTVTNNRVTGLSLHSNNLIDTLPSSIGNLTALTDLELDNNTNLTGNIPSTIGNLTLLTQLTLSGCNFIGTIPSTIGNLKNLTQLILGENNLSGNIPNTIGGLINLNYLYLEVNKLSGSIPSSIGALKKLTWLYLYNNNLTGTIPSEFGNMSSLNVADLRNNQLSGSLPNEIGNLSALNALHIDNNLISGALPQSLRKCPIGQYGLSIASNYINNYTELEYWIQRFGSLSYYPQYGTVPIQEKTGDTLFVSVGGNPVNNTFNWYINGAAQAPVYGDSFFVATKSGKYTVQVNNGIVTQLNIQGDTIQAWALPIKDVNFQASYQQNSVKLSWQTYTEINTAKFVIQSSTDGITFIPLGNVEAKGTGNNSYNFTDTKSDEYYRLQIIDKDGSTYYSKVVSVQITESRKPLSVYPNPAKDLATICFNKTIDKATIAVFDLTGKAIITQSLSGSTNVYKLNTQSLANGVYVIKVNTATGSYNEKLLINK